MEYLEFFKTLIPVRLEWIVGAVTGVMGMVINNLFGGFDEMLQAILILMVLDYSTGIIAAWMSPNTKLDSQRGFQGIGKKVVMLCMIALGYVIGHITGQNEIRDIVIWFYIGNESLSILENVVNAGVPVPNKLKENLAKFTEHKEKRAGK